MPDLSVRLNIRVVPDVAIAPSSGSSAFGQRTNGWERRGSVSGPPCRGFVTGARDQISSRCGRRRTRIELYLRRPAVHAPRDRYRRLAFCGRLGARGSQIRGKGP